MDRSPSGITRSIRLAREGQQKSLSDLLDAHRTYLHLLAASCLQRQIQARVS